VASIRLPARLVRPRIRILAGLCVLLTTHACSSLVIRDPLVGRGTTTSQSGATLSRTQAITDLDGLFRAVERVHPAPYRFQPREAVDAERQRLIDTMPESQTRIEFCLRVSRLLATLDEGHTGVRCDQLIVQEWRRAAMASPPATQTVRTFPPYVLIDDQQHLIVQWPMYVPGLESGDRILRVNGHDLDALLAAWSRETSRDTEAARRALVARTFRAQLALRGISAPYRVEVARPGARHARS
jgi:hypothetical protein